MPQNFVYPQRDQPLLLPVDMREWLPEDDLAFVVLDAVATLDLGEFRRRYRADGHGRAAFDPEMIGADVSGADLASTNMYDITVAGAARNLAEMRRQAAGAGSAVIWMTPTACDPERIAAYPPFQGQQIWLEPGDLRAVSDAVRAAAGDGDVVVDLSDAFASPPDAGLLRADGLHPTLAGYKALARRFVETLAGSNRA